MLDLSVHGVQVQVWGRTTTTDSLGNTVNVWTVNKGTEDAIISPVKVNEIQLEPGETIDSYKKLIVSKDSSITKTDRIEYNNIKYEPVGGVDEWVRMYRGVTRLKIILVRRVDA